MSDNDNKSSHNPDYVPKVVAMHAELESCARAFHDAIDSGKLTGFVLIGVSSHSLAHTYTVAGDLNVGSVLFAAERLKLELLKASEEQQDMRVRGAS